MDRFPAGRKYLVAFSPAPYTMPEVLWFQGEDKVGIHVMPLPPLKQPGQLVPVGPPQTPNMVDVVECQLMHNKCEATSEQVLVVRSSKDALEVWLDVKPQAAAEC